jgi:hypothetical protein
VKTVISASRRTDLVALFPEWMAAVIQAKRAHVIGPRGRVSSVDLNPQSVHTVVLWSKNFGNLLRNEVRLRELFAAYDQLYLHFTVTGLGGTPVEPGAPAPEEGLAQLPALVALAGGPERVSLRFDPILFWRDGAAVKSNLPFFGRIAEAAALCGVRNIRTSFAQWYPKARKRASVRGFDFVDPPDDEKKDRAAVLAGEAGKWGLALFTCCQPFLTDVEGIRPSACVDGRLLEGLHPGREPASRAKDASQRTECLCTESRDIGSYTQVCPHGCVYCYANPAA